MRMATVLLAAIGGFHAFWFAMATWGSFDYHLCIKPHPMCEANQEKGHAE